MTKNAQLILEIINMSTEHLTAEEIYNKLLNSNKKMSMATVYNSLHSLHELGLIRKIPMEGNYDRYDKTIRHDHLICKSCGKISDANLNDLTDEFKRSTGLLIEGYDLKLFHLCNNCKMAVANK